MKYVSEFLSIFLSIIIYDNTTKPGSLDVENRLFIIYGENSLKVTRSRIYV